MPTDLYPAGTTHWVAQSWYDFQLREPYVMSLIPQNFYLIYNVQVPLLERGLHEHVDENYSRTTLYFPGHVTHVHIDEGDIAAPWTAEVNLFKGFKLIHLDGNYLILLFIRIVLAVSTTRNGKKFPTTED